MPARAVEAAQVASDAAWSAYQRDVRQGGPQGAGKLWDAYQDAKRADVAARKAYSAQRHKRSPPVTKDVTSEMVREIEISSRVVPSYLRNVRPAKSMTPFRKKILAKYDGLRLGFVSKAPIYDEAVKRLPKTEHKALLSLIKARKLHVCRVNGPLPGEHRQSRIGAHGDYHYVLRSDSCDVHSD